MRAKPRWTVAEPAANQSPGVPMTALKKNEKNRFSVSQAPTCDAVAFWYGCILLSRNGSEAREKPAVILPVISASSSAMMTRRLPSRTGWGTRSVTSRVRRRMPASISVVSMRRW